MATIMDDISAARDVATLKARYLTDLAPSLDPQEEACLRKIISNGEWLDLKKEKADRKRIEDANAAIDKMNGGMTPLKMIPTRSDADVALEYRERLLEALAPVSHILTEASQEGFTIGFAFAAPDSFKHVHLAMLEISKKLC